MAELPTPGRVNIPGCPPLGGEPRFVGNIYDDGLGRITYCRPPFWCVHWPGELAIPDYYDEPPPLPLTRERDPCKAIPAPTPRQLAAASLPQPGAPLAPRLPREPRQARAPRPPRLQRPARRPRPGRAPRKPRRPRRPRARTRPPGGPRRERKRFYCEFVKVGISGQLEHIATTGPWSEAQIAETRAKVPKSIFVAANRDGSCPNPGSTACAAQAALVVRPLQAALGWKRPEFPTPKELRAKRLVAAAQSRYGPVYAATLQPPPPLSAPEPPPPPAGTYLCYDPRITPPAYRRQTTPCVPPQVPYPE